jgi:hypothetical protein
MHISGFKGWVTKPGALLASSGWVECNSCAVPLPREDESSGYGRESARGGAGGDPGVAVQVEFEKANFETRISHFRFKV